MPDVTQAIRDAVITRPIIGIENRTAQEVFEIMCERIARHRHRTASAARIAELEGEVARLKGYAWQVVDTVEQAKDGTWHFVTGDPEQLLSDMMSACDYDPDATTALGGQS